MGNFNFLLELLRVEVVEPVKKTVQLNYIGNRATGDCLAEMVEEVAYLLT